MDILDALRLAPNADLYRLYLTIGRMLDDPKRILESRRHLHIGMTVSYVADDLTQMMVNVVDRGTGSAARIAGVQVAGKTGTAQSAPNRPPYAWFVSFAPADNPQVAVAVLVQDAGVDRNSITGNGLAAPIARAVMQAVIQ